MATAISLVEAHAAVAKIRKIAKEHRGPVKGSATEREFKAACDLVTATVRAMAGADATPAGDRIEWVVIRAQANTLDLTSRTVGLPDIGNPELCLIVNMADGLLCLAENALAE